MYLITVAVAAEDGHTGPLPMALLAGSLEVSPVSANQMVRKLAERGLLEYHPYHGVELTPAGAAIAGRVLRVRRLWATFLAERLELTPAAADRLACRMEHVTPSEIADRLAAYLGSPDTGPLGRRIPPAAGAAPEERGARPLTDLTVGCGGEVLGIEAEAGVRSFLAASGITPGAEVRIEARGADGSVLVATGTGPVHLAAGPAAAVLVVDEAR